MTQQSGWRCLQGLLGIAGDGLTLDLAQYRSTGALGFWSAVRSSSAAHWASWADSLPMIQKRHPAVARLIIAQLTNQSDGFHLSGATFSRERLLDVSYAVPTWVQVADGLRQANHRRHGRAPSQVCLATDGKGCGSVFLHSWCGTAPDRHSASASEVSVRPACSCPFTCCPTSSDPFRTPTPSGYCFSTASGAPPPSCPRPFSGVAVHSTLLATTGPRAFRGCWADEVSCWRAAALVCREAGSRVSLNVRVGDLDLPPRGAVDQTT